MLDFLKSKPQFPTDVEEPKDTPEADQSYELHEGEEVIFFQGRRPLRGTVVEKQDDGRILVRTSMGDVVKDKDEIRPAKLVKGRKTRVRFQ